MIVLVDKRSYNYDYYNSEYKDSIDLHGKIYEKVYTNTTQYWNTGFDLYYSKLNGLVGFKDRNNPDISLKFDRWE